MRGSAAAHLYQKYTHTMTTDEQKEALWEAVTRFIDEQRISCAEAIAQNDDVITNAYEFIEELCEIVGYYEYDDEE